MQKGGSAFLLSRLKNFTRCYVCFQLFKCGGVSEKERNVNYLNITGEN